MKHSHRGRRMQRHHGRNKITSKLNLVSLMDIFTILVFFLLLNSSDVEILQNDKTITLPESVAEQKPDNTLVVMVNNESLLVGGRPVASVAEILEGQDNLIPGLAKELQYQVSRRPELTELEQQKGRAVTIMGDHGIPYALLKRVMTTCADNDYRNISLAVTRVARLDGSAEGQEG